MAQERGQPTQGRGHSPSHREPRVGGRGHTVGGELRSSPDPARKHLQPQVLREPCAESRRNLHGHREVPAPPHGPARWHCPEATSQRGTGPGEVPQPARDHAASGGRGGGDQGVLQPQFGRGHASQKPATPLLATGCRAACRRGQSDARKEPAIDRFGREGGRVGGRAPGQAQATAGARAGWGGLHSQAAARRSHLSAHLSARHRHRQPAGSWSSPPGVSRCRAQR